MWGLLTFISSREISSQEAPSVVVRGPLTPELIREKLDLSLKLTGDFPAEFTFKEKKYDLIYTISSDLENHIKRVLQKYRPEHTSVVILDNATGEILAAVDYERARKGFTRSLSFSNTHPAASMIKIITAADLLRTGTAEVDTVFSYRGRSSTLYKNQLTDQRSRRERYQTLESAFAVSNNVIFGKAAIENLVSTSLFDTAEDFGFNHSLLDELSLPISKFRMPDDQYDMAQLASGFNVETTISPVHASLLSLIVANDGKLVRPRLLKTIKNEEGEELWIPEEYVNQVIDLKTAEDLKELMRSAVSKGTARRGFRRMNHFLKEEIDVGGKTGSMTGGSPFGKRDWFTAFAMPRDEALGKGISIAVMNINSKKWYVKSSVLAKEIIEYYFDKIVPMKSHRR